MESLALIPARSGSRRIPGKNIKHFGGKPIIAYTIEAALASGVFEQVMVSTDDPEIASIALSYGARVPFLRSLENSGDQAHLANVIIEVLENYRQAGMPFSAFCCLLATAPFLTPETIRTAKNLLMSSNANMVVTVSKFAYPIQRALKIQTDGKASMYWPENYNKRSQDLEPSYHDAGQLYFGLSEKFFSQPQFFTDNTRALVLPEHMVQDIDTPEDWEIAEFKLKHLQERAGTKPPPNNVLMEKKQPCLQQE